MFTNVANDEDDDDFIKPETSTKLANLFGTNQTHLDTDASNKSLIYTAPKQPKRFEMATTSGADTVNSSPTNAVMTLIHASAVNVFKFDNDKYTAQGKLGAALLGNHDTGSYKMVLYTGKQQHITVASITDTFNLICQPNNYSTFYDDNRQNWSLMFDTEEDKCNFNRQLTVCKYNSWRNKSSATESAILTQDLMLGNEKSAVVAEDSDHIELRYKGWLFDDSHTLGKLFVSIDSSAKKCFRVKLSGKWTDMLSGMRIGSKRFAIISHTMKDELKELLENAPLSQTTNRYGFEFEVIKIQNRQNTRSEAKPPIETKPDIKNTISESDNSRMRSQSSSLSDVNDESQASKQKSDILTRMARMGGLPILPVRPEVTVTKNTDTIDTTTEVTEDEEQKPFPKPRNSSFASNGSQMNDFVNNSGPKESNAQNYPQIPVTTTSSSASSTQYYTPQNLEITLSMLTTETRTNNSEIRMNLNKIIDKIDLVSERVADIKTSSLSSTPMHSMSGVSSIGFMDSAILLSSIQRIVDENNSLKKDLENKTSNLQKLNEKICDLLAKQTLPNTSSSDQQNTQQLEQLLMSETRLKRDITILNEDCDRYRAKNEDLSEENHRLRQTVKELRTEVESRPIDSRESKLEFKSQLKRAMNDVFRKFNAQMDENRSYSSDEIVDIVSNSIKSATLAVIDSQTNSHTNSPFRRPVDEIDKNQSLQQNTTPFDENNTKPMRGSSAERDVSKPPVPMRKTIDGQQNNKTSNLSDVEISTQKSSETTED